MQVLQLLLSCWVEVKWEKPITILSCDPCDRSIWAAFTAAAARLMAEAPLTWTQGENVILQLQIITSGAPWCRVGELHHIITIGTDRNIFRYALIMLGAESLCFQITFEISLAGETRAWRPVVLLYNSTLYLWLEWFSTHQQINNRTHTNTEHVLYHTTWVCNLDRTSFKCDEILEEPSHQENKIQFVELRSLEMIYLYSFYLIASPPRHRSTTVSGTYSSSERLRDQVWRFFKMVQNKCMDLFNHDLNVIKS